jgi:hypothetical protein
MKRWQIRSAIAVLAGFRHQVSLANRSFGRTDGCATDGQLAIYLSNPDRPCQSLSRDWESRRLENTSWG